MNILDVIKQCNKQIELTPVGVEPIVSFMIPGPANGNKKKLIKAPKAPFGKIVAEYETSCLVVFNAKEVKQFAISQLTTLTF